MKRLLHFLVLSLLVQHFGFQSLAQEIFSGKIKSWKLEGESLHVKSEGFETMIYVYSSTVIRIRSVKTAASDDFSYAVIQEPGNIDEVVDDGKQLEMRTDSLVVLINKKDGGITISNSKGQVLSQDYSLGTSRWNDEFTAHKKLFPDEKFIGLGEKTGPLNRRGNAYENWNTDDFAYTTEADPLYKTIPFYIGIHDKACYGIFLDNSYRSYFNFGASTDDKFMSFTTMSGEMNYYFFGASSPAGIIKDYTWLTGHMKMPPLWSLGFQQSRWSYMSADEVMTVAKNFREKKIPCDVIYNDIDYMDRYRVFTWNGRTFPEPPRYLLGLKKLGFHPVVIIDPGIAVAEDYQVCTNGKKNDAFVKYPNDSLYIGSVWPGRCHFPDFTKEEARKWWGTELSFLTDIGVEGFWNDMNEPAAWGQSIPMMLKFDFDGHPTDMRQAHNVYGMQMTRATYDGAVTGLNGKRPFVLTRATFAGGQRYSSVWTGDNDATDEHMLMGTRLVSSLGLCGFAFAGSDIGGFAKDCTKELYLRWLNIGIFTPFMRSHSAIGTSDREPWAMGEFIEADAKRMIELRYQLLPYIYTSFYQSTQTGIPVQRMLPILYPNDPKVYETEFENEYVFGDHLLIVPCKSTDKYTRVYLPKGDWYRWNENTKVSGERTFTAQCENNSLPVYVRAGAIIPMQDIVQYTGEMPSDTLTLHVYYSENNVICDYYEDDGSSLQNEKEEYYKRHISYHSPENSLVFMEKKGKYPSHYKYVLIIPHGFEHNDRVIGNFQDGPFSIPLTVAKE